jgi:hypothetical protein
MSTISSEGVTPPSSLLRAHVPLPLGSPLLQHLASFEESLQVVRSSCRPRELPDAISESLSLDAGSPTPAVHRVLSPCFFHDVIGLPSLLAPQIVPTAAMLPQGSQGFYVRAYRALLPPHAPDMLTVRRQVIDGTGTCTLLDSQPCRLPNATNRAHSHFLRSNLRASSCLTRKTNHIRFSASNDVELLTD